MFSRKKRNAAPPPPPPPAIKTAPAPPPIPPGPPPSAPFLQAHARNPSAATATTASSGNARETPLVSPLQMTFDFELPPRSPFSQHSSQPSLDSLRPRTSDGLGASSRKSHASLAPPSLPPIPRVASGSERNDKVKSTVSYESGGSDSEALYHPRKHRDDSDNVSISSKKSAKSTASRKSFKIFEMTIEELNKAPSLPSRPVSSASNIRPSTSNGLPKMEGTLFPKHDAPVLPPLRTKTSGPLTVDRSFVDSRDKAFQPAPPKMPLGQLQASSSTPDLSGTLRGTNKNVAVKSPLSPQTPASATPPTSARSRAGSASSTRKLQKKASRPDLQGKRAQSNLSGTTIQSSQSGPNKNEPPTPTVGTPYAETSPLFALPQHVATRPKTAGAVSTVAGVSVPTHHTSSQPSSRPETAKSEKRKTKFLNPMAMFSRRKSSQNEVETQKEIAVQQAALARQRDVAAAGVKRVPNDFDPRIKGKVVHDFSAPNRQSMRSFTFNDAAEGLRGHHSRLQTANSPPNVPAIQQDGPDVRQSVFSGNSSISEGTRKSMHAPVFVEHLSDTPMGANRMNAERAESLANRDFLQRASHVSSVSQESAVLPPFARRSQVMDPLQASHLIDDGSKRSSDPSSMSGGMDKNRDSGVSSFGSVSPITARNSVMPLDTARQSLSPISPTSPSRSGFGSGPRPKSMASSHLRESTVFFDEEEAFPQQRPPLHRNAASDQSLERIPSPPNRNAPLPPPRALSPPSLISPSVSPAFSNVSTPAEEQVANTVRMSKPPSSPAKLVEKLASAVGHSKRKASVPKHNASNASRFSFQMGASAAEELALEEKARQIRSGKGDFATARGGKARTPSEEDEDDYFDEDAMDDMDEMELREDDDDDDDELQALPPLQHSQPSLMTNATLPPKTSVPPRQHNTPPSQSSAGLLSPSMASPGFMNVNDARLQLMVSESDGEDMSGEDEESASEGGYYDFVDYGSVSHSRGGSVTTDQSRKVSIAATTSDIPSPLSPRFPLRADTASPPALHSRVMSDDSALTLNTRIQPNGQPDHGLNQVSYVPQESAPSGVAAAPIRNDFYMQPTAAGYESAANEGISSNMARDSGNAGERVMSEPLKDELPQSPAQIVAAQHKSSKSNSTMSSSDGSKRPFSDATIGAGSSSRSSGPRTGSTGLGLSGFSEFHFSDSPDNSRPMSKVFSNENRLTGDSETMPQHAGWMAQHRKRGSSPLIPCSERNSKGSSLTVGEHRYTSSVGKNAQARKSSLAEFFNAADAGEEESDEDDMYFDGGGFEGDLQTGKQELGASMNEEVFDDDRFRRGQPMLNGFPLPQPLSAPQVGGAHQRDVSGMSVGSDGPYPSFAMPNPVKARQRDSQMLLEDLVLQAAPPDPRYIPQRNPSEDAKRLGLSSKVPPLPPQPGNIEAAGRVQNNLQAYHAALADAANKAAIEGRFLRMPSVSTIATQRSASVYSKAPDADKSADDLSRYEEKMPSDAIAPTVSGNLGRSDTQQTTSTLDSALNHSTTYSNSNTPPPKMSFDFGFDSAPLFEDDNTFDLDDFGAEDDDIVAAANAEALASDDAGFYGQEFGFFAKARPNSGDGVQSFNGGYLGEDGDDGLSRNKSLHEPNLTPITERSEFSTRNSFIGAGGMFGPPSAGAGVGVGSPALARLPVSPLMEGAGDITSFDQLRKLRMNAFGGSNASLGSNSGGSGQRSAGGAGVSNGQGYFGASAAGVVGGVGGGSPMQWGYSSGTSDGSSNSAPVSAHPRRFSNGTLHDSPAPASAGGLGGGSGSERMSFSSPLSTEQDGDFSTPRKPAPDTARPESPQTARKAKPNPAQGHSRTSSGADSVTYVQEQDPNSPHGQPRWVLERRRTSELGLTELVGREVVKGGWI